MTVAKNLGMNGVAAKAARRKLGLTVNELADALLLSPQNGGRKVRRWEAGDVPVSGPVAVALEAMLNGFEPEHFRGS